jgi:hypothetical protein
MIIDLWALWNGQAQPRPQPIPQPRGRVNPLQLALQFADLFFRGNQFGFISLGALPLINDYVPDKAIHVPLADGIPCYGLAP